MPKFDQDFIEKVREANNLIDIIGQYTELKGRGDQYMGLCPFPDHVEKTPSFSVSESRQLYHCFGCKKSGNIFSFLRDHSGLPFVEAVEFLARRAHIEIPKSSAPGPKGESKSDRDLLIRVSRFAAYYYYQQLRSLPEDHPVKHYLRGRGLEPQLWEEFKLGYAPAGWDGLTQFFKEKKVDAGLEQRNLKNLWG